MTTRQTTQYAGGHFHMNRGLTRALQTDAALNPNLFHYNTNVLHYYLLTPRVVVHSTSDQYRRAK